MFIVSSIAVLFFITTIVLIYLSTISQNKIDIYEQWIIEFTDDVNDVYLKMKDLDDKNLFQKDDEVGIVFSDMATLIDKLNTRTKSDVNIKKEIKEDQ